jgi:SAM-dependent methyltransferase
MLLSNSMRDRSGDPRDALADQNAVRAMYERAPYPDLGASLKDMSLFLGPLRTELAGRKSLCYLDAGCGTGHALVSVAKQHPTWDCYGLDLSQPSLDIAMKLAERHSCKINVKRGSYLDPLPFNEPFDVIAAIGTIHHAGDPVLALRTLGSGLRDDGYLLMHVYGLRLDREKFDIKEMLSIFEPDLGNAERRFFFYDALMQHRRRNWLRQLAQMPLIDIFATGKNWIRNLVRRSTGTSWSPPFTARYDKPTAPWIDHFCHPCERAYEVPDVVDLVRQSGLEIYRMLGQGREYPQLIPPQWISEYEKLPAEAKWRLSELLAFRGASFRLILRKAR